LFRFVVFFFSSRRRHTRFSRDWSSDVCSSDLEMSLSAEMMGNVSMAAFIGQMIGSLFGSYIADVIGRRPVILICTVLSAVLTFRSEERRVGKEGRCRWAADQ